MRRFARRALVGIAPLAGLALAQVVHAQSTNPTSVPPPAASSAITAPIAAPTASVASATNAESIGVVAGGLTADQAGERAMKSSKRVKVDQAKLKAAESAVDAAWDQYWPRLSFTARYTRLSPISYPPLDFGTGPIPNPFPIILNNYLLQGSLDIPLSDYVFRIFQAHEAALKSEEAAKWQVKVTQEQARLDARVAYYNWLRAKGSVVVAKAAIGDSEAHLKDVQTQLALKAATTADVFRVQAQLASAQLALVQSENLVITTEANLRLLMHASDDEGLALGEDVTAEMASMQFQLKELKANAMSRRAELKAIDAQIDAGGKQVDVASAAIFPRLDAIGNVYYARPNSRFIPQVDEFRWTWDVSLQLTWSPNDALIANDQKKEAEANVAVSASTREELVDAINLEVITAYTTVRTAEGSVVAAGAELRAAEEAYRVRMEQFHNGAATSSMVIDAESDLTRARLAELNARVDLRIAHAQLKKAVGE